MIEIPVWAWTIIGGLATILLTIIGVLVTRELKRIDSLHTIVAEHIKKEEVVWVSIKNIETVATELGTRMREVEAIANGNVGRLTDAIHVMTQTLDSVLERRKEPRT